MKKIIIVLVCLYSCIYSINAQKQSVDEYKILNNLIRYVTKEDSSATFILNPELSQRSLKHYYDKFLYMDDSIQIFNQFDSISLNEFSRKMRGNWKRSKVEYGNARRKNKPWRDYFTITPFVFSKSQDYFFVVVDHSTHSASAVFRIVHGKLELIMEEAISIKCPKFR